MPSPKYGIIDRRVGQTWHALFVQPDVSCSFSRAGGEAWACVLHGGSPKQNQIVMLYRHFSGRYSFYNSQCCPEPPPPNLLPTDDHAFPCPFPSCSPPTALWIKVDCPLCDSGVNPNLTAQLPIILGTLYDPSLDKFSAPGVPVGGWSYFFSFACIDLFGVTVTIYAMEVRIFDCYTPFFASGDVELRWTRTNGTTGDIYRTWATGPPGQCDPFKVVVQGVWFALNDCYPSSSYALRIQASHAPDDFIF